MRTRLAGRAGVEGALTTGWVAGGGGFEPPLTGPEPVVLPLDDPPVCAERSHYTGLPAAGSMQRRHHNVNAQRCEYACCRQPRSPRRSRRRRRGSPNPAHAIYATMVARPARRCFSDQARRSNDSVSLPGRGAPRHPALPEVPGRDASDVPLRGSGSRRVALLFVRASGVDEPWAWAPYPLSRSVRRRAFSTAYPAWSLLK